MDMMRYIIGGIIVISVVFSLASGRAAEITEAMLTECNEAVTLAITLCGIICLWSGIMRVASDSGVTKLLARLFRPLLSRLFVGIDGRGRAMQYIVMNLAANLLGLGNASTPFGIAAMRELEKEEKTLDAASRNMIILTVMNTASLQIIPTTVAALRLGHGSSSPMEILPCVWITSAVALVVAVSAACVLCRVRSGKKGKGAFK